MRTATIAICRWEDQLLSQCADARDRPVGNEHVISLEPEFIVPQDGHEKQDCEIQAGKRWLEKNGEYYAKRGAHDSGR